MKSFFGLFKRSGVFFQLLGWYMERKKVFLNEIREEVNDGKQIDVGFLKVINDCYILFIVVCLSI